MKKLFLTTALVLCAGAAQADTTNLNDPLHGQCLAGCTDNGTNTPIASNPPVGFGFTVSPAPQTGTQFIDFLVPDVAKPLPGFPGIDIDLAGTNTLVANAQIFSLTPWTSGFLDDYLGISASPSQPIGAYLPASLAILGAQGAGVDGFFVFQADLGTQTLQGQTTFTAYDANKGAQGMYIVSFLQTAGGFVATANSGALFETGSGNTINPVISPGVPEPGTWVMMLLGFIGLAFAFRNRRRTTHGMPAMQAGVSG